MKSEYWVLLAALVGVTAVFAAIPWAMCLWDKYVRGKEPLFLPLKRKETR